MVYAKHSHDLVGLLSFISAIFTVYLLRTANAIKNLISDVSSLLKFLIKRQDVNWLRLLRPSDELRLVMVLFVLIGA